MASELIQLKGIGRFEERERGDGDTRPSILDPQSSIVHPLSSILDPQSLIVDSRSSVLDPPSSILHPQFSILDPRSSGKQYWRSLEELAETDEFQELLHREFPDRATEWSDPVGRRKFLKLMAASFALAGLTACTRQPAEYIAPYVRQPEELVPGKPVFFATAMALDGFATGLIVESHEGRPTKIEGNKDHPASLGATDVFSQASVLGLYDPDRSQTLTYLGEIVTWSAFLGGIRPALDAQRAVAAQKPAKGGLRILSETVTSPTLAYQIKTLLAALPTAKWHQYDAAGRDNVREGSRLAFGQYANTIYHFDKADVVLSLDSDFLACGPASLRYARDFAAKRRLTGGSREMSRLYVVESTVTNTGSVADHRLPVRPSELEGFARETAAQLGVQVAQGGTGGKVTHFNWIEAVAKDLKQHSGSSIVIAGESQPPVVHALAHSMNQALGNVGNTVVYTDSVEANPVDGNASLRELVADMNSGQVDVLLILGGNPVYNAPADLDIAVAIRKVPLRIHLSLYKDETSELCQWHIPEAHYLESWSDARAYDGTVSIIQPLIAPLYAGKTAHEVLAAFLNEPERPSYEIVRDSWRKRVAAGGQEPAIKTVTSQSSTPGQSAPSAGEPVPSSAQSQTSPPGFEQFWRKSLHDGLVANTALQPRTLTLKSDWTSNFQPPTPSSQLEIVFRPDPTMHDGRFSNNGWLQELPKPLSKLTWDNAAIVSPATAASLDLGKRVNELSTNRMGGIGGEILADRIELQYRDRTVIAPVFIQPGQPDNVITVHLGYGRTISGRVGTKAGFNAYAIRTSDAPWFGADLRIAKIGGTYSLATTQSHHLIDASEVGERDILRSGTLEEYAKRPSLAPEKASESHNEESLYSGFNYDGYAWGMAIDLNSCIGCTACVVACVAENNIPVVGKEQVARSREMHWLRIDAYYKGGENKPETYFQPVPCQQCENAPCEVVCPVAATAHSAEGLNDMTYNRCVGTRYCSNNCPYKVRRFNFLLYQDFYTASLKMMRNPDVSVRSRGVMEKCTYCVQRIQKAKIDSEKEDRQVRDGEIVPACAQACPTEAIVFGNINDRASRVAQLKAEERNYSLLGELNTRPRTTYLGAVRNKNPELEND
ncbi:MAG TPA: TAT-variant-translocated molybdopterin oxidoreductase [Blastocatellia bacterium]|nr:TAT-variant-translocated molybdopterin oxidoreductase [Blastocatellia bacterium]